MGSAERWAVGVSGWVVPRGGLLRTVVAAFQVVGRRVSDMGTVHPGADVVLEWLVTF